MVSVMIILAIVLSIFLGYKTKINTGIFGMVFAYIIGVLFLEIKPSAIIKMWPLSIFFVIFAVSLFYNFAVINGTLEKLSEHLLYTTKRFPKLLLFEIFLASTIMSSLGAGFFAVLAFFAPIAILLCKKTNTNLLMGALAANYGALCGHNFLISPGGVVFMGLMGAAGYEEQAMMYQSTIFGISFVIPLIILFIYTILRRNSTCLVVDMDKPEPFNRVQKKTLSLILVMISLLVFIPFLHNLMPTNQILTVASRSLDVGLISIIFVAIGLLMKLGNEKDLIKHVPWSTLIMICGVGMLISVALKAGTIAMIAAAVSDTLPAFVVPMTISIIAGIMSFFSSTTGVVAPALFPLVPDLSNILGIPSSALFSAIVIGAQSTAISPFSTGGSLLLSATDESERQQMFSDLIFKGVPLCLLASIAYALIGRFLF